MLDTLIIRAFAYLLAVLPALAPMPAFAQSAKAGPAAAAAPAKSPARERQHLMQAVKSWGYQLHRVEVDHVAASPFDLVVVDYARTRSQGREHLFTVDEVRRMQTKADGSRRLVVAYLSFGEAEWYRFYWNSAWLTGEKPGWLGDMNPQWYGNFPVRFWDPAWQDIILREGEGYLARIMAAGFDGVYLDRADVYADFAKERTTAEADMVAFITRLAEQARRSKPTFLVIQQNAEELLGHARLRQALDGVAKESLVYGMVTAGQRNSTDEIDWSVQHLRLATKAGRKVLVIEYLDEPKKAADARAAIERNGFVVTFGPRMLHHLDYEPLDRQAQRIAWPPPPKPLEPLDAPRPATP